MKTFYRCLRDSGRPARRLGGEGGPAEGSLRLGLPTASCTVGGRTYFREWGFTDGFDSEGKIDVVLGVQKQRSKGCPSIPTPRCWTIAMTVRSMPTSLGTRHSAQPKPGGPKLRLYDTPCALAGRSLQR